MIKKKKTYLILLFAIILGTMFFTGRLLAEDYSYILALKYSTKSGALDLKYLRLTSGTSPDRKVQPEQGFRADIVSFNNNVLYSFRFEEPRKYFVPPRDWFDSKTGEQIYVPEGEPKVEEIDFTLVIPYFPDASSIKFFNSSNNLILDVDVSKINVSDATKPIDLEELTKALEGKGPAIYLRLEFIIPSIVILLSLAAFIFYKLKLKNPKNI